MKHFLAGLGSLTVILVLLVALVSGQSAEVPTQDPSNVDIDPELESKFQQEGFGFFSTDTPEKEQVFVKLQGYKGRPTKISEMKSQASKSQSPLLKMVEKNPNIEVKNKFWITNAVLLEASNNIPLENIASVQGVESLNVNAEVEALQSGSASGGSEASPQASNTYGMDQINATETWSEFDTRGEGVKVSVIDTGIDINHADLDLFTTDESDPTYPGGWAEFKNGTGKVDGSEPKVCSHGGGDHGTHVSGTVSGGNASGTNIGVAPNVSLMNVGALMNENPDGNCVGDLSDIAGAMQWSVENDADILSMSLGAAGYYSIFNDSVENAHNNGTIVIGASGNSGEGTSISPSNIYNVSAIGASNSSGGITSFSSGEKIDSDQAWNNPPESWPSEYIVPDLAAPGENVYSSEPGNSYGYKRGTSMATPHVSGAAALMQSATYNYLSPENISEAFVQTAWKPDSWDGSSANYSIDGQDTRYGHGIIDAYAATEYAIQNFDRGAVIENVTVNNSEAEIEEIFAVSGDIENLRNEQNDVNLELKFNDSSAENQTINLNSEESKSFQFEQSISEEGYYEVYVNETFAGGLDVDMPDPDFSLSSQLNDSEMVEGGYVNVSGTVDNAGGDGDADLRLLRNGTEISQQNVFVSFESDKNYSFVTDFTEPGYYNISVNGTEAGNLNVLNDAQLNLSNFQLNNTDNFFENDTVEASVTASNIGDVSGLFNISLKVDESLDQSVERNISGGSNQSISFDRKFSDRGNYTLSSGNLSESLEVLRPGSIELLDSSLSNNTIVEGDSVNYTLQAENPGDVQASSLIEFMIDSQVERSRNVTVEKQSNNDTVFNQSFDSPGNYTLAANSTLEKDLEVLNDAELNITGLSLSNSSIVEGENISVNVSAQNIGDVSGSFIVPMNITGGTDYSNNKSIELDSGDGANVVFTQNIEDPGNYSSETVNYTKDFEVLNDANISVNQTSVNSTELFTGQSLRFNATVENTGDVSGLDYLNYSLGDIEKASNTGEVSPGKKNISETLRPLNSGNFSAKINGSNVSDVEVEKPNVTIGDSTFNVSEKGLIEIETLLNNTDSGLINESLTLSINESNFTQNYFLDKNEERNVTGSVDWNETGFYILKVNGSEVGNFSLDPYSEFSELSPNSSTYTEGDTIEFSGNITSVGEPNLTVETGSSTFKSNLSSGLDSFSFEESPSPGTYQWDAQASFNNSTFTSESLSYEVEEESSNSDNDGGSSGGGGGGGFSGGGPPSSLNEAELEVNESAYYVDIRAPEGEHSIELNETNLPVKQINFSSSEEGTFNLSRTSIPHNGTMESIFQAETDLDNSFNLRVEASNRW
ncbi:MAG: S8 family serine peptidase, partial [Candidatus Nanohaloarchaea archaeon]